MYTAIALAAMAVAAVILEIVALRREGDQWWTITRVFRWLPKWATALIWFFIGVLLGHFYWP